MLMAKEVADGADRHPGPDQARGPKDWIEELRLELYEKVNALGIGAQGLGGLTTVLDVKIMDYPTHAASKPVCDDPELRRHPPRALRARRLGPGRTGSAVAGRLAEGQLGSRTPKPASASTWTRSPRRKWPRWKPGQTLLLNGKMLTGRDAAHKRMVDMLAKGEKLPVDFRKAASSTTSARSIRCATRWSARPARPPPPAWTSSPPDARADRPARHGRQGRARPRRHRGDQEAQGGLPDGRGRRRLPGVQGDPAAPRSWPSPTWAWKRSTSST